VAILVQKFWGGNALVHTISSLFTWALVHFLLWTLEKVNPRSAETPDAFSPISPWSPHNYNRNRLRKQTVTTAF